MKYPYCKVIFVVNAKENEYFIMNCVFEINIAVRNAVLPAPKAIFIYYITKLWESFRFYCRKLWSLISTFFVSYGTLSCLFYVIFVFDRGKTSRYFEKMS